MAVFKTIHHVIVLAEFDTIEQCQAYMANAELPYILDQMDSGDLIGAHQVGETTEVMPENLLDELDAVGNDGTFFGTGDDEEED